MALVAGYLTIMDLQPEPLRKKMSAYLKEIMEDGETFRLPTVRAYHAVWLQHIEQGRATWNDETTWLKLHRSLVWHRMTPMSQPSPTLATTSQAPTRAPRHTTTQRDQACVAYTQGLCSTNVAHPADIHMCSFCLQTAHRLCQHSELNCRCKMLTKNGSGGHKQLIDPPSGMIPLNHLPDHPAGHEM